MLAARDGVAGRPDPSRFPAGTDLAEKLKAIRPAL